MPPNLQKWMPVSGAPCLSRKSTRVLAALNRFFFAFRIAPYDLFTRVARIDCGVHNDFAYINTQNRKIVPTRLCREASAHAQKTLDLYTHFSWAYRRGDRLFAAAAANDKLKHELYWLTDWLPICMRVWVWACVCVRALITCLVDKGKEMLKCFHALYMSAPVWLCVRLCGYIRAAMFWINYYFFRPLGFPTFFLCCNRKKIYFSSWPIVG